MVKSSNALIVVEKITKYQIITLHILKIPVHQLALAEAKSYKAVCFKNIDCIKDPIKIDIWRVALEGELRFGH
jgi:hypothetical protein